MLWKYKSSYKKTQNLSYVENGKERETLQHCMADLFSSQQMTLYTHTHTHTHTYTDPHTYTQTHIRYTH